LFNGNTAQPDISDNAAEDLTEKLVRFCGIPRTREALSKLLNVDSISYMMVKCINPLLETGKLQMTIPGKPKSRNQKYYSE
jgi:ATP-dependent DNA helicase RecG